jgi:Tfp pilus assembly protein PilN
VFGRKLTSATNISKAATTIRSATRVASERQDVSQAEETVEAIQQRIDDLNSQFEGDTVELVDGAQADALKLEEVSIPARKTDITIVRLMLCWTPWTIDSTGSARQAW